MLHNQIKNSFVEYLFRSSGRARLAELPPSHPIRREERQRQREREKRRDRGDDSRLSGGDRRDPRDENKPPSMNKVEQQQQQDPRRPYPPGAPPEPPSAAPNKPTNATEWHDPWMRTQTGPAAGLMKSESKSGLEAVSDSSSSDSDSDSDSGFFLFFCSDF